MTKNIKGPNQQEKEKGIRSFPINVNETIIAKDTIIAKNNERDLINSEQARASRIVNDLTYSVADSIRARVLGNMNPAIHPALKVAYYIIGGIGSFINGDRKTSVELVEESLDPNLREDRNQTAGGASIVSVVIGFVAANQSLSYLIKPFKWIGTEKVLGDIICTITMDK
jgi:hypothetical protein